MSPSRPGHGTCPACSRPWAWPWTRCSPTSGWPGSRRTREPGLQLPGRRDRVRARPAGPVRYVPPDAGEGLPPEFWFAVLGGGAVPAAAARGLRDQPPSLVAAATGLDAAAVQKALTGAFNLNEIAAHLRDRVPEWMAAFPPGGGDRPDRRAGPSFVKAALDHAGIDAAEKQEQFAALLGEYRAITPQMVRRLEKAGFTGRETADLQTSFRLAELTKGDFSTVRIIKEAFKVTTPDRIRALAGVAETDWVELVTDRHAAGEITVPLPTSAVADRVKFPAAEFYGRALARRFRDEFPTAAFAGDLGRATRNGGVPGLDHAPQISRLLDQRPQFDLLTTPVDEFLDGPDGKDLDGEDPAFRLELQAVQRLFKLAPGFDATTTLMADRVRSAQQIYAMGQAEFVERYAARPGFTAETARIAWNHAADTHAAVLTIVGDLSAFDRGVPVALGGDTPSALSSFPNWNNLFQTGDFCECDTCRSVLGPAAYLADLLRFLRDRPGTAGTAKEVLFRRRPDLGWLELNCANGSVPLPYIDVVNEVLEAVVAPGATDQELAGFTTMPTDPALAKQAVLAALARFRLDPGDSYLAQVRTAVDQWVLHGEKATYRLRKKATPNFFAELLPNTKATADEVRAYPQYVNAEAYRELRQAIYPYALPFDLFAEEVRAAFQKSNLQRWDVMRALGAADGDVAAEHFGIGSDPAAAVDEKRLILVADPTVAGQQVLWGETGGGWLNAVGNVSAFLRKTGLEYNDMLALLDLPWINPKGDIAVEYLQPSCDVAQQRLRVLDAAKLDRIHRFLRLWRKLPGWQMWELDLALTDPAVGKGVLDESFLVNLFRLSEGRRRLGRAASVEQVLALFGDLNTRTRFTEPFEPRADALYQTLFLNRRLIQPLDAAFQVPLPAGGKIGGHRPVVLAALGITETDLATFQAWNTTDDLTLASLSFLWRHSWLAKTLKHTAEEWRGLLHLFNPNLEKLAGPAALQDLLDTIDAVRAAGFTVDELGWLLGADRSAKAATKEADTATFLRALRKQLQTILATYDPGTPPTDVGQLDALLTRLLAELKRGDAEARSFLATLRGRVILESGAAGLPAAFAFPAAVTDPHHARCRREGPAPHRGDDQRPDDGPAGRHRSRAHGAASREPAGRPRSAAGRVHLPRRHHHSHRIRRAEHAPALHRPDDRRPADGSPDRSLARGRHRRRRLCIRDPGALPAFGRTARHVSRRRRGPPRPVGRRPDGLRHHPGPGPAGRHPDAARDPALPPITYDAAFRTFGFTGLMTTAEQTALKAAGNPATVIDELFRRPRLAVKFFEPVFTAPLEALPTGVDFPTLLPPELAARIAYDEEERLLRFTGVPSADEVVLIRGLSTDLAYRTAVDSLSAQPTTIVPPDRRVWLTEPDLDPANTLAQRLTDAAVEALRYLSDTQAVGAVADAASTQLGLTPAVTRHLATDYPPALLDHLTGALAASTGVVDHATLPDVFDAWYWADRVATIWRKGRLTLTELRRLDSLVAAARLLDVGALPLTEAAGVASLDEFLRLARLLRLRDTLPEPRMTLLDLLRKLKDNEYGAEADVTGIPAGFTFPAALPVQYDAANQKLRLTGVMSADQRHTLLTDPGLAAVTGNASYQQAIERLYHSVIEAFAADAELVAGDWTAEDVAALILQLDLRWPADYLLPESWERLALALAFAGNLNASAATLARFAQPAMGPAEAKTIKELLRSKLGAETWLTLCAEIQDVLRERKRDALAAYLLTQPKPADAPTGKWENTNDLYAYYVLDVDMGACQLTSRIVQASGSVQLYVQRCFMGLEPSVPVMEDGVTATARGAGGRDAQVPGLGGQPEDLPVAGELDRAGAAARPVPVLHGPGERADRRTRSARRARRPPSATTWRSWTASRISRSPGSTRKTTTWTRSSTSSAGRRAASPTSTTTGVSTFASGRRGSGSTWRSRATT